MNKYSLLILFVLLWGATASNGQSKYAVSAIPNELKSRASAIIRNEVTEIEIKDINELILRVTRAVTIMNESGDDEAELAIWYDKTRQIKSINGFVYNEFGLLNGKVSEKDFKDNSAVSDYSLFEDSRIKRFSPAKNSYPYTIEYTYELRIKQSLVLPEWNPVRSASVSIELSSFTVLAKPDFAIRYKILNKAGEPKLETNKQGYITYKWQINNFKAIRKEPFSPDPETYLPSVKLAPVDFAYQNTKGSFSNWKEYGTWVKEKLLKDRDVLSEQTKHEIRSLVSNIDDPKLKAKKIYEYLQEKTRYISVQIGIGGFQPIPAADVDRLGYGDCKALVNYMMSLLNVVDIKSYYTIVEAGSFKKDAIPDFASINQFNHVILCLPFANDTTWIDCTSKTLPFGFLGDFTDDRTALACTEDGGKLLKTPKLNHTENLQYRKAQFNIGPEGQIKGSMTTTFEGSQYSNRESLIDEPTVEQLKELKEIYKLNLNIDSFNLKQEKTANPVTTETISFSYPKYGTVVGERLLVPVNLIEPMATAPREVSNRTTSLFINRGYTDKDEIIFQFPESLRVDTKPPNNKIEKPFGQFSSSFEIVGNKLVYTRLLQFKEGNYSAELYSELVEFYQKIVDSDNSKILFHKKL